MAEKAGALIGSNLHKRFLVKETGQTIHALNDVSLEISTGSLSALVGPDGAGKTTLLRMVAGLMTPDEGRLEVLGIDVAADPQAVQDRIGYMPQRFGLYEDLTRAGESRSVRGSAWRDRRRLARNVYARPAGHDRSRARLPRGPAGNCRAA